MRGACRAALAHRVIIEAGKVSWKRASVVAEALSRMQGFGAAKPGGSIAKLAAKGFRVLGCPSLEI